MAKASEPRQPAQGVAWAARRKAALRSYFYSGWAFFVPYLLAYFAYARFHWPANPNLSGGTITDTGGFQCGSVVPPLLHVYWVLHLLHLALAAWALRSWWKSNGPGAGINSAPTRRSRFHEALRRHWVHWFHPVLPWVLLALVLYIPGVYLEWPSDPWEHLRRITEWQTHPTVSGHSAGYKSFYFLAYTLVGWVSPRPLLACINIYYTVICLCLAWQYYLFGRTVGLDRRWAIAFVAFGAVTFGNSSFSYYRYYGLASTIFSQIAAVALTRVFFSWVAPQPSASSGPRPSLLAAQPRGIYHWSWLSRLLTCTFLLALISCSHIQGLGIAALGAAAIIIWRLIEWKRSMVFWIVVALVLLNAAAVAWWPRHWMIDSTYRQSGWMNAWYGFDILSVGSEAFERTTQILGLAGLVNLFAGLWLLRRNEIVGWLTVTPTVALLLPIVAIPFANMLAEDNFIVAFHRMLLAVPSGLAMIRAARLGTGRQVHPAKFNAFPRGVGQATALSAVLALALLSPSADTYGRLWQFLARTPNDLRLSDSVETATEVNRFESIRTVSLTGAPSLSSVLNSLDPTHFPFTPRWPRTSSVSLVLLAQARLAMGDTIGQSPDGKEQKIHESGFSQREEWSAMPGSKVSYVPIDDRANSATSAVETPPGMRSDLFCVRPFRINPAQTYALECDFTLLAGIAGSSAIAVQWLDAAGTPLVSNADAPRGAGNPPGWHNGAYSSLGNDRILRLGAPVRYAVSFGPGGVAAIPSHAVFARIGVLLNVRGDRSAVIRSTDIALRIVPPPTIAPAGTHASDELLVAAISDPTVLFTPRSTAALLSAHWPPQTVSASFLGRPEWNSQISQLSTEPRGRWVILKPGISPVSRQNLNDTLPPSDKTSERLSKQD